jgi:hypothetical protein
VNLSHQQLQSAPSSAPLLVTKTKVTLLQIGNYKKKEKGTGLLNSSYLDITVPIVLSVMMMIMMVVTAVMIGLRKSGYGKQHDCCE